MPRPAAFFDLDRTLVACNTGRLFLRDLRRRGQISMRKVVQGLGWLAKYHLSIIDLETVANRIGAFLKGRSEQEFAEQCQRWVEDEVLPLLLPIGLRKIDAHRSRGHVVALLSSTASYVARPLARTLNLDDHGSTQFEVKSGHFTGELLGPACFGRGKVHWAEDLGRRHDLDLGASWFYTDSYTDMPMLERVGHQVVVNPDPRLKREARTRGWLTETWAAHSTG